MFFQFHYITRVGPKVESEDKNLPKEVMLAFNLELNKDGSFCKRGGRGGQLYNASSYSVASSVITKFYEWRAMYSFWLRISNKLVLRKRLPLWNSKNKSTAALT